MRPIKRNGESELEQKLLTPTCRDNAIKTDALVVVLSHSPKQIPKYNQKAAHNPGATKNHNMPAYFYLKYFRRIV